MYTFIIKMSCTKKDVEMGLFVQCLYALSLHLASVVFGTAIPTSLYIFGLLVLCIHSCKCVCVFVHLLLPSHLTHSVFYFPQYTRFQ